MTADYPSPDVTSDRGGTASNGLRSLKPADAEPLQLTLQAAAQIRGLIIDRVLLPEPGSCPVLQSRFVI